MSDELSKWEEWNLLMVELTCLHRRAEARFDEMWEQREDWKNHEARYHVYKAHDQLSVASYHARQDGTEDLVKTNLADCLNHLLMAMATYGVDHDGCQPVTDPMEWGMRDG